MAALPKCLNCPPVLVTRRDSTLAWQCVSNNQQGMERQCPETPTACISDPVSTREHPWALPLENQKGNEALQLAQTWSLVCQCHVLLSNHPFRDMMAQCGDALGVWGRSSGLSKSTSPKGKGVTRPESPKISLLCAG